MRDRQPYGQPFDAIGRTPPLCRPCRQDPGRRRHRFFQGGRGEERVHALELADAPRGGDPPRVPDAPATQPGPVEELAETLVVHGVSSAIGFHSQVRDDVQRAFVNEILSELLAGRSVEAAFAWSRQARRLSPDWWMPVLVTQCPTWRMLPAGPLETSSERSTGNLPAFDDQFVGRKEELEALRCVILAERRRLVTVTGIGGLGKTRLAIEAASRMAHEFMDGVWIVPCDGLSSSEQLFAAIATSLKIDIGSASLDRALEAGLADRRKPHRVGIVSRVLSPAVSVRPLRTSSIPAARSCFLQRAESPSAVTRRRK